MLVNRGVVSNAEGRKVNRRGFTLIEVLIALVILSLMIMGLTTATAGFVHVTATSDREVAALQLAQDRIQAVQIFPNYTTLETSFNGTESNFPTLTGYTRQTQVVRVGGLGLANDYKRITVTVNGPGLPQPIKRSVTVAAP